MLTGGMYHLALTSRRWAMLGLRGRGDRQIDQVVVSMFPDMQDGLPFHLVRLRIVGLDLIPHM